MRYRSWKGYATSAQLRYVLECIIEMLHSRGLTRILGEDTALPTILAEDQRWIAEDWMPRAAAAGLLAIASKRPATYFGQVAVESVLRVIARGVSVRLFDNVEEARAWLRSFGSSLNPQPAT